MDPFRPREVITRSRLWRDAEGEQWLLVFSFTTIRGRLECCGFEMRSFLRVRAPAGEESGPSYPAWWDGDPYALDYMKGPSILRLQSAWPHPPSEAGPDEELPLESNRVEDDDEDFRSGLEDCLPFLNEAAFSKAGEGSPEAADFELSPEMARPRPLRAETLRHLRLASEIAKSRRFVRVFTDLNPHWSIAFKADEMATWVEKNWTERDAKWAPRKRPDGRVARYSLEDLKQVAAVYIEAYKNDMRPTKAVAEAFGLTRDRAAKLVMKCRAAGLLGQTRRGAGGIGLVEPQHHDDEGGRDDDTT